MRLGKRGLALLLVGCCLWRSGFPASALAGVVGESAASGTEETSEIADSWRSLSQDMMLELRNLRNEYERSIVEIEILRAETDFLQQEAKALRSRERTWKVIAAVCGCVSVGVCAAVLVQGLK